MLKFKGKASQVKKKEFDFAAFIVEAKEPQKNSKIRFSEDLAALLNLDENEFVSIVSNDDGDRLFIASVPQADQSEYLPTKRVQKIKTQIADSTFHENACEIFELDPTEGGILAVDPVPAEVISKEDLAALPTEIQNLYNNNWYRIMTVIDWEMLHESRLITKAETEGEEHFQNTSQETN